nr:hypothetical protein [Endozoicomonas sp.]
MYSSTSTQSQYNHNFFSEPISPEIIKKVCDNHPAFAVSCSGGKKYVTFCGRRMVQEEFTQSLNRDITTIPKTDHGPIDEERIKTILDMIVESNCSAPPI